MQLAQVRVDLAHPPEEMLREFGTLPHLETDAAYGDPHARMSLDWVDLLGYSMLPTSPGGGLYAPIIVHSDLDAPGQYVIIDGYLRWMAARCVGLETIYAIVVDEPGPGYNQRIQSLIANWFHRNLSAIEIARGLVDLNRHFEQRGGARMSWRRVEQFLGMSTRQRQRYTILLKLPTEVQDLAALAGLSERALRPVAELLGRVADAEIIKAAEEVAHGRLAPDGRFVPYTVDEGAETRPRSARPRQNDVVLQTPRVEALRGYCARVAQTIEEISHRSDLGILDPDELDEIRTALAELQKLAMIAGAHVKRIMAENRRTDSAGGSS